jgi:hypothetical protein
MCVLNLVATEMNGLQVAAVLSSSAMSLEGCSWQAPPLCWILEEVATCDAVNFKGPTSSRLGTGNSQAVWSIRTYLRIVSVFVHRYHNYEY